MTDSGRHTTLGTLSFALCFAAWGLVSAFALGIAGSSFAVLDRGRFTELGYGTLTALLPSVGHTGHA